MLRTRRVRGRGGTPTEVSLIRAVSLVVLLAVALAGCARPQPLSPRRRGGADGEAALVAAVRLIHGDLLAGAFIDETSDDSAALHVDLVSGEPTGTQPFAVLSAFVSAVPGRTAYRVTYFVPEPLPSYPEYERFHDYYWQPHRQTVELWVGSVTMERVGSPSEGSVSEVSTATLEAIAAGRLDAPAFTR